MVTALLIVAIVVGFYVAWNIGANDVANAVGTSVGSGALTLKQAVLVAAIFEFAGAFFLGGGVSETVESGIVNPEIFSDDMFDYVFGMLASLFAAGIWLQTASFFGWPVSTTHSIVGAVVGFGLVLGGFESIYWGKIGSIALSWIISPLLGGVLAYLIFSVIRKKILYNHLPLKAAKRLTPYLVFAVFFVLSLIILYGGLSNIDLHFSMLEVFLIAIGVGGVTAFISSLLVKRIVRNSTLTDYDLVEKIFIYLQIIVACFMALAHGSNDVANAIGPLSAIFNVLQGKSIHGATVPLWLLLLGGAGIIIGLATWGWRVIETVGKKITELTPSRGFAAGFGAATTIVLASKLGLPISTTHVLVGAVLGVGFARGIGAINLTTIRDIVISWVVTVPAGAVLSVIFFYALRAIFSS